MGPGILFSEIIGSRGGGVAPADIPRFCETIGV